MANRYGSPWILDTAGPLHPSDAGLAQAACIGKTRHHGFKWVGYTANGTDTCVVEDAKGNQVWKAVSATDGSPISEARFSPAPQVGLYLKTLASGRLVVDVR